MIKYNIKNIDIITTSNEHIYCNGNTKKAYLHFDAWKDSHFIVYNIIYPDIGELL